ncbi:MAG: histidine phosphotransferase family protein [Rhodospirillaceae bacterium]|jgi:histidine phosphotransferase ChpT
MIEDLKIAHLLCTRLCHDLAGPVGAVSAGVELIGSDLSLVDEETLSLLSGSADAAGRKLKFLRLAFGWSGSGIASMGDLSGIFEDYLIATSGPSGRPTLSWPDQSLLQPFVAKLGDEATQVISNLMLLGVECMPSCRSLIVECNGEGGAIEIAVKNRTAEGRISKVRDVVHDILYAPEVPEITPHTIQAYHTRLIIEKLGGHLSLDADETGVVVKANWG